MKKKFALLFVFVIACTEIYAINEKVVVWEQIYNDVSTDEKRIAVLLKIMEFKDRDFTPFLSGALDRLINRRLEEGTTDEQYAKNRLARLLVQELGNLKSLEAAESVFRVYEESAEPHLKSEAAIALGKMRAAEYAERLSVDLASINLAPKVSEARSQEIIAIGLVQSLIAMRSTIGYEPVFLASFGWYSSSSRIKETASAALPAMVDDPTDSILDILVTNPSLDIKIAALETSLRTSAPDERKIQVATQALKIGIERVTNDIPSRTAASNLRKKAMTALSGLKDNSPDTVPLLIAVIKMDKKDDATLDETLKAYVALGINGSDAAADFLSSKLTEYNNFQKSKANTVRDKSLIRQIVTSMVLSQNPKVKTPLVQAQFIDYDNSILRMVSDALTKIPD